MNFHESAAVGSAAVAAVRTADHHHEQQLLAAEAVRQAVERCQIERVSSNFGLLMTSYKKMTGS